MHNTITVPTITALPFFPLTVSEIADGLAYIYKNRQLLKIQIVKLCSQNILINTEFVVDASNPGLTDIFLNQVRREQHLRTPLSDEEIKTEAARLLSELQAQKEPNSPHGTHFMAQFSPDFMARGNSRDMNRLMSMLPFRCV